MANTSSTLGGGATATAPGSSVTKPAFKVYQETLVDLLEQMRLDEITVPPHQREYCWTLTRQQELVDTVMTGLPIPVVILYKTGRELSLEDGHQRLKTLAKFRNNEFQLANDRFYRDLTVEERADFDRYPIPVLCYRNASATQQVTTFNRFQNGSPLTVGERLHSLATISPLVRLTKRLLLTRGEGLHDRASATWGDRAGEDTRRKNLMTACALVAGLAFDTKSLSRKWGDFEWKDEAGVQTIAREIDDYKVMRKLEAILRIYERANAELRVGGKAAQGKLWNPGTFTGYIVYTLNTVEEARWPEMEERWAEFIAETRRTPEAMKKLTDTIEKARMWTIARWQSGCKALFPDVFDEGSEADTAETEDSEEDEM